MLPKLAQTAMLSSCNSPAISVASDTRLSRLQSALRSGSSAAVMPQSRAWPWRRRRKLPSCRQAKGKSPSAGTWRDFAPSSTITFAPSRWARPRACFR